MYIVLCSCYPFLGITPGILTLKEKSAEVQRIKVPSRTLFEIPYGDIQSVGLSRFLFLPLLTITWAGGGRRKFVLFRRERFLADIGAARRRVVLEEGV